VDNGTPIDEYDGGVKYVDDYIGRLLRELERQGGAENTIVIITSDHGESLGEHGMNYHGISLYWNLIHVPLIISYPGHLPAGLRVATPVSNAAIPATVMSLLGGKDQKVFPDPALNVLWNSSKTGLQWPDPVSQLGQNSVINTQDRLVKGKFLPPPMEIWNLWSHRAGTSSSIRKAGSNFTTGRQTPANPKISSTQPTVGQQLLN